MSAFDRIHDPSIPPAPAGFVPITEVADKLREYHWPVNDESWKWNLEMLDDEQLLTRYHNAAAELTAQGLALTDDGEIVAREFSQKELEAARALENYWRVVVEVRVRKAVREILAAVVQDGNL